MAPESAPPAGGQVSGGVRAGLSLSRGCALRGLGPGPETSPTHRSTLELPFLIYSLLLILLLNYIFIQKVQIMEMKLKSPMTT